MDEVKNKFLKKIKTNIISWYSFKENSTILIVGDDVKEYQEYLESKGQKIFLENSFIEEKTCDYIIVFDKLNLFKNVKKYLKPDGIVLFITNNSIGIRNISIDGALKDIINNPLKTYSKKQIEQILNEEGYENYKFYYPLPDYKTTNVIFSDGYLPEHNNTKLINNNYYQDDAKILFKETELLKEVTKNGEFTTYTNSYFVEVNNKSEEKFIGFNNTRKDEYRLCTKIYNDYVVKEEISEESKKHIQNMCNNLKILEDLEIKSLDSNKDSKIYSKYVSDKTLYKLILDYIFNNQVNTAIEVIKEYYEFLKERFNKDKTDEVSIEIFENTDNIKALYNVKNGLIDLVFENAFKIDNEYVVFDQEWNLKNIPLEFILYRAINNMYIYNSEVESFIPKKSLYNILGLEDYISDFKIAEKNIQEKILDMEKRKVYRNSPKAKYIIIEEKNTDIEILNKIITDHKNHINRLEDALNQKDTQIEQLKEEVKQKQLTINYYENMRVVKFTKKLKNK